MFIVGIDIAKRSHEAIVMDHSGNVVRRAFNFANTTAGLEKLLGVLGEISQNPDDFNVAMESTAHYWLALYSALKRRGYTVQVLNPLQSNALRGLYIRQVKNDQRDCFIIAEVIRFGRYTQGNPPTEDLFALRELCRARVFLVNMVADIKKKVIALLDQVFPEYETIFANVCGMTSSELLSHCATPEEILAIDTDKLVEILEGPSRKRFRYQKAEQIKEIAQNSFGIIIAADTFSLLIKQHIEHIRFIEGQLVDMEAKIAEIFSRFNSCITTIPGIGPVLGATILSEIGDISRFPSATKLVAFAGIDPTVQQSGEFTGTHNHMSKRGSPYLRRALWQAATIAVRCDPVLKAFHQKKLAEGKPYMNSIGHVTRKLTNIIFAIMRDNQPYAPRAVPG
jgi:transposase